MLPTEPPIPPQQKKHGKKPRNAASLILYQEDANGGIKVLMGKRHTRARFAPDVYVFPGGALDRADFSSPSMPPPHVAHMGVSGDTALAQALCKAALREAQEETGLVLRAPATAGELAYIGRAITPAFSPVRYHARFFAARADLFEGQLAGDGELQDLHWASTDEAQHYPLIDVTAFMLKELCLELTGQRTHFPLFTYYGQGPRVFYRPI